VHDLSVTDREDREELAVELDARDLEASVVSHREHHLGVVGAELDCVDLSARGPRLAEPLEHLLAPPTADIAGDVHPVDVAWKRSLIESMSPLRSASIQSNTSSRLARAWSLFISSSFGGRAAGPDVNVPLGGARAPPPRRAATGRSHTGDPHPRNKPVQAAGLDRRAAF
jgi:hypothetical protein